MEDYPSLEGVKSKIQELIGELESCKSEIERGIRAEASKKIKGIQSVSPNISIVSYRSLAGGAFSPFSYLPEMQMQRLIDIFREGIAAPRMSASRLRSILFQCKDSITGDIYHPDLVNRSRQYIEAGIDLIDSIAQIGISISSSPSKIELR